MPSATATISRQFPAPISSAEIQLRHIREALTALRTDQDGIEQSLGLMFDEVDASWDQLDHDRSWIDTRRQEIKQAQVDLAAQRSQWEADRQQWHDALQQRVVELEKDRLMLQSELESARTRAGELTQALADERQRSATERAEWTEELRLLREALDRQPAGPIGPIDVLEELWSDPLPALRPVQEDPGRAQQSSPRAAAPTAATRSEARAAARAGCHDRFAVGPGVGLAFIAIRAFAARRGAAARWRG